MVELPSPVKAGEDFGLFGSRFPSCLVGLGAGKETPVLHSPDYDFPDDLIGPGVALLRALVDAALGTEAVGASRRSRLRIGIQPRKSSDL